MLDRGPRKAVQVLITESKNKLWVSTVSAQTRFRASEAFFLSLIFDAGPLQSNIRRWYRANVHAYV